MKLSQHCNDFVKGALIGSVLGSVVGLLFAPKTGRKLRDDISDSYHHMTDKGQHYVEAMKHKGEEVLNGTSGHDAETWLVGGAVGAVIGATAALLLAPQSGEELREALGDKYEHIRDKAEHFLSNVKDEGKHALHEAEDKWDDWKETLKTIVEKLTTSKKKGQSSLDDVMEWANVGLRLIKQVGR